MSHIHPKQIIGYEDLNGYLEIISELLEIKKFSDYMNMDNEERIEFKKEIKSRIRDEKINTLIKN
jgi:hypothetical protein